MLNVWLAEGTAQLAGTLRAVGSDAEVWTPIPGETPVSGVLARRSAHETVIHRVDATLAIGTEFTVGEEVALDALHEWMELGSLPQIFEVHP